METTTEQKISSLKYFSPEVREQVKRLRDILESDIFLERLVKSLGEFCWEFHPSFEPGKNRPQDLNDETLKHDLGKSFFDKFFKIHLQPYNHRVLWTNGKTPILLDRFLDGEIKGWKEFIQSGQEVSQ